MYNLSFLDSFHLIFYKTLVHINFIMYLIGKLIIIKLIKLQVWEGTSHTSEYIAPQLF